MCGIFFYASSQPIHGKDKKRAEKMFKQIQHRGPDASKVRYYKDNIMFGFHRLAIVDPTGEGMQPFEDGRYTCIVNGEIYNHKELKEKYDLETYSHSDCEVVLALFKQIENKEGKSETVWYDKLTQLCYLLDGEYAFIIYDSKKDIVYYGVDELRTRPLFLGTDNNGIYLASEQKALVGCNFVSPISSGHVGYFTTKLIDEEFKFDKYSYFNFELPVTFKYSDDLVNMATTRLRQLLTDNVVNKLNPEREYGFLLSGGLDSSLICGIAAAHLYPQRIRTFTVGFDPNASDVLAAAEVAKHIDSIHTTFIFSFQYGLDVLPEVIRITETWDQTSIRASVPMYLLLRAIKNKHPEMAVIFSGEQSDELFMGYMENKNSPSLEASRELMIQRLRDIYMFDGLRADRVVSSVGCELRLPFFSKQLLNFVMQLHPEYLSPTTNNNIEKFLLRKAFDEMDIIPQSILWRTKNAFSDATSIIGKNSWKEFLKTHAEKEITDSRFEARQSLYPNEKTPQTKEDMLYREIFDRFEYEASCVAYKWLPAFSPELTDASATELSVFTTNY